MASKRTKSYALVQIHLDEDDFMKLNYICEAAGVNKTDMIRNIIRGYYDLLNDGLDRDTITAHLESVRETVINIVNDKKEEQEMDKITYEPRKDCFAYPEHSFDKSKMNCKCLTEMICVNRGKCPFYKKKGSEKNARN